MFKEYPQFDATGIAALVARRDISAMEALDAALARLEAVNPKINAFCTPMIDAARARAAGPLSGPFAGVPFLIKDIAQHVQGVPTSAGSRVLKDWCPDVSSEVVLRFERAGLLSFGKTTVPELALKGCTESPLWGPTRNPWNLDRTPGGSSGGAAARRRRSQPASCRRPVVRMAAARFESRPRTAACSACDPAAAGCRQGRRMTNSGKARPANTC